MVWDNKHKYSTYAILVIIIIIGGTIIASSIDSTTSTITSNCSLGYSLLTNFRINASDILNLGVLSTNLTPNGIECATGALNSTNIAADGTLSGTCRDFPDTYNTTEQIRAAINNSVGYNITITTGTSGSGGNTNGTINNLTMTDVDNTITTIICLLNDTCLSDSFTDSTGSYDDTWISPLISDLQTNLSSKGSSNLTYANIVSAVGNWTSDKSSYTTTALLPVYNNLTYANIVSAVGNWTNDKSSYYLDALGDSVASNATAALAVAVSAGSNDTTTRTWFAGINTTAINALAVASSAGSNDTTTRTWFSGINNTAINALAVGASAGANDTITRGSLINTNNTANNACPKAGCTITGNITTTTGLTTDYFNSTVYANVWNGTCYVTRVHTSYHYQCPKG